MPFENGMWAGLRIFGLRPHILWRLGKTNKFVLLSASAYICNRRGICLIKSLEYAVPYRNPRF